MVGALAFGCSKQPTPPTTSTAPSKTVSASDSASTPSASSVAVQPTNCGAGHHLTVHFYDVGQALAALVDLPDGRHILVDTGDSPKRPGCGASLAHRPTSISSTSSEPTFTALPSTCSGSRISTPTTSAGRPRFWRRSRSARTSTTGATSVSPRFDERTVLPRSTALRSRVVDPEHPERSDRRLRRDDRADTSAAHGRPRAATIANDCSIGLRIDFCSSSVLFTGDAEHDEEAMLDPRGRVTLLQVAHHGSETSTTPGFLAKIHPSYAVISAGKPGDGMNADYCHPRAIIVKRLTTLTGGPGSKTLKSFDGIRCANATASDWVDSPDERPPLGDRARRRRRALDDGRRDVREGVAAVSPAATVLR